MALTPSGLFATQLIAMKNMVAASANFQTWVSAADAAEAASSIYYVWVPDSVLMTNLPWARIDVGAEWEARRLSYTGMDLTGGSLQLEFRAATTYATDWSDSEIDFLNHVGPVIEDVMNLAGQGGYLALDTIALSHGPSRSGMDERKSVGDIWQIIFDAHWS